jgi:hypothetical protein
MHIWQNELFVFMGRAYMKHREDSETPSGNCKTCDICTRWTKFKTPKMLIVNNNHNNILMILKEGKFISLFFVRNKEGLYPEEMCNTGRTEGAGRRVCVQLLTVSSCRPSVHRPPGKLGGERNVTPRNALFPGAPRRLSAGHSAAPLFSRAGGYSW